GFRDALRGWGGARSKEPAPDVVGHRPEPFVADALAVDAGHVGRLVPHDVVDGRLILHLVAHRPEGVAEGVKPPPPSAAPAHNTAQPAHFLRDGIVAGILGPWLTVLRHKDEAGAFFLPYRVTVAEGLSDGIDCLRPQVTAAGDARLGAGVVDPAPIEVQG